MYDVADFTYGAELEYADVLVGSRLPGGCYWSNKDYTIVNSSGISNDEKAKLWPFGGEINTRPTDTVDEQVEVIDNINCMLSPAPVVNYKCNLHIHVGVPGLVDDLEGCRRLMEYITRYGKEAMATVDPLPEPERDWFRTEGEYIGAMARRRRNLKSHQLMLPCKRLKTIMKAKTADDFFNAHAPIDKRGNRMWFIAPRAGINVRHLIKTGTVEFRHFFQTLDKREISSCLIWCREFMRLALAGDMTSPLTILDKYSLRFPTKYGGRHVMLYDHQLHRMFEYTNAHKNKRGVVRDRLDDMTKVLVICLGNINRSPATHTILKQMLLDRGSTFVAVDSAATSKAQVGKKTTKRMRDTMGARGYSYYSIRSKQITQEMVDAYDLILYMSDANLKNLHKMFGNNSKFVPMTRYSNYDIDKIPDPHTGSEEDYNRCVDMIEHCCNNIVEELA